MIADATAAGMAVVITAMVAATDTAITNGVVDTIRGGAIHAMPITAIGIMGRGATGGTDITSYPLF